MPKIYSKYSTKRFVPGLGVLDPDKPLEVDAKFLKTFGKINDPNIVVKSDTKKKESN